MKFLTEWWGVNNNITPLEISARAAVMFIVALVLVRSFGMRPFGKGSSFDTIITFLIGGIMSRGVVGATPFFSAIAGAISILIIHKIVSKIAWYDKSAGRLLKGEKLLLYKNHQFIERNMRKTNITEHDIYEELRMQCNIENLNKVKEVYLERTGELSIVKSE